MVTFGIDNNLCGENIFIVQHTRQIDVCLRVGTIHMVPWCLHTAHESIYTLNGTHEMLLLRLKHKSMITWSMHCRRRRKPLFTHERQEKGVNRFEYEMAYVAFGWI